MKIFSSILQALLIGGVKMNGKPNLEANKKRNGTSGAVLGVPHVVLNSRLGKSSRINHQKKHAWQKGAQK